MRGGEALKAYKRYAGRMAKEVHLQITLEARQCRKRPATSSFVMHRAQRRCRDRRGSALAGRQPHRLASETEAKCCRPAQSASPRGYHRARARAGAADAGSMAGPSSACAAFAITTALPCTARANGPSAARSRSTRLLRSSPDRTAEVKARIP
jgi:hypothetical protein